MARGVFENKGDVALNRVLRYNEFNKTTVPQELSLKEQLKLAESKRIARLKEKERAKLMQEKEDEEKERFISDSFYFKKS